MFNWSKLIPMTNILVLIIILITAIVINALFDFINSKDTFSFEKLFNNVNVPIVTLSSGENKLNFLLDTGSTNSHISKVASKLLVGTVTNTSLSCVTSMGVDENICKAIYATLNYNNKEYIISLFINKGLDDAFADTEKTGGVTIHGILGSDFINKYSCIIDFNKYIVKYGKGN